MRGVSIGRRLNAYGFWIIKKYQVKIKKTLKACRHI